MIGLGEALVTAPLLVKIASECYAQVTKYFSGR